MKIKNNATVSDVIPSFLSYKKATQKDGTYRFYKQYTGFISKFIGDKKIKKLDRDDIAEMIQLKRIESPEITNATLNKYITTTNQVYKYVTGQRINFKKLKEIKKEMSVISEETIKSIFVYLANNNHKKVDRFYEVFFRIMYDNGIRLNEIRNLKISNIDFHVPKIKLEVTKTDKERTVYISNYTHKILLDYIRARKSNSIYLFPGRSKEIISEGAVYSKLQNLKKILNFPETCSPHSWRHTFGTRWIEKDGQLNFLQDMMGHSKPETTKRYLHFNDDARLLAYQKFSDSVGSL